MSAGCTASVGVCTELPTSACLTFSYRAPRNIEGTLTEIAVPGHPDHAAHLRRIQQAMLPLYPAEKVVSQAHARTPSRAFFAASLGTCHCSTPSLATNHLHREEHSCIGRWPGTWSASLLNSEKRRWFAQPELRLAH